MIKLEQGIQYIQRRRGQEAADGTVERGFAVLNAALNLVVDYECLDRNRLRKIPVPKGQRRKRTATKEELQAIQLTVQQSRNSHEREARRHVYSMFVLAINTGLRQVKILGMEYAHLRSKEDGWWWFPPEGTVNKGVPEMTPLNEQAVQAIKEADPWALAVECFGNGVLQIRSNIFGRESRL